MEKTKCLRQNYKYNFYIRNVFLHFILNESMERLSQFKGISQKLNSRRHNELNINFELQKDFGYWVDAGFNTRSKSYKSARSVHREAQEGLLKIQQKMTKFSLFRDFYLQGCATPLSPCFIELYEELTGQVFQLGILIRSLKRP